MSVTIKSDAECDILREGGKKLSSIVDTLCRYVHVGMYTNQIDQYAQQLILESGGVSAFMGYRPHGVKKPYPASVCVSVNEEIVHGIPGQRMIYEGDIVSIDCGLKYKGLFTDHARTVIVGSDIHQYGELLSVTEQALDIGIATAVIGNSNLDIGSSIERFIANRFGIVRELSGHGVGYAVHEDPYIPNYAMKKAQSVKLKKNMVLAIEPMLIIGSHKVEFLDDEYTVVSSNGLASAHSEDTIIITESGPEIITRL